MSSRRRFVFTFGAAALASVTGAWRALAQAPAAGTPATPPATPAMPQTPPPPSDEAKALHSVVVARYGKALSEDEKKSLLDAIEGGVQSGKALRAKKLGNAAEPDVTFRAGA